MTFTRPSLAHEDDTAFRVPHMAFVYRADSSRQRLGSTSNASFWFTKINLKDDAADHDNDSDDEATASGEHRNTQYAFPELDAQI